MEKDLQMKVSIVLRNSLMNQRTRTIWGQDAFNIFIFFKPLKSKVSIVLMDTYL